MADVLSPHPRTCRCACLLREFSDTVYEEINYKHEADNAETFFENFKDDKLVNVPRVVQKSFHPARADA